MTITNQNTNQPNSCHIYVRGWIENGVTAVQLSYISTCVDAVYLHMCTVTQLPNSCTAVICTYVCRCGGLLFGQLYTCRRTTTVTRVGEQLYSCFHFPTGVRLFLTPTAAHLFPEDAKNPPEGGCYTYVCRCLKNAGERKPPRRVVSLFSQPWRRCA